MNFPVSFKSPAPVFSPRGHEITEFRQSTYEGLSARPQKWLAPKYFYDERGSDLFGLICETPEYYITRTELSILKQNASEIGSALGPQCLVVEFGSGAGMKTQILLDALENPVAYVPIEISESALDKASIVMRRRFPMLKILPICADFTQPLDLPGLMKARTSGDERRRVVFFPGSTLGNFNQLESVSFLRGVKSVMGESGALLLGIDLVKSEDILEKAYNDRSGVTAAFNRNLLLRINRELQGEFELENFQHIAFFNSQKSRIEMHLRSSLMQNVRVGNREFHFEPGETIHTENSYKYTLASVQLLAAQAGLRCRRSWVDQQRLFSVLLFEVT